MRRISMCLLVAAAASTAQAELVVNGGFEGGPGAPSGSFTNIVAGGYLAGWTVGSESVDVHHTGHTAAHSGTYSLDLAGFDLPGSITQSVATVPGQQYTLTFWYAAHPYHPYDGNALAEVYFDGAFVGSLSLPAAGNSVDMNWTFGQVVVTATSSVADLSFVGTTPNGGLILDDISLVPAPASILSIAAAPLFFRRRR